MKKLLLLALIALTSIYSYSQTATDFTAPDCAGNSHNLFTELNAGKIIVLVWVMPCGSCIGDAKAGYDAAQSFATTNPGKVLYWLSDDFGNNSCATLTSWANTNGIVSTKITVFGNVGTAIDEANYGGSAMPHVVVLAGGNHKVYLNKLGGSNDGPAIMQAISQAITTGISQNDIPDNTIKLFPNPAQNKITLQFTEVSTSKYMIDIYNLLGEKIQTVIKENEFTKSNLIEINLADNLPNGTYVLKLSSDDRCRNLKFTIIQ